MLGLLKFCLKHDLKNIDFETVSVGIGVICICVAVVCIGGL